MWPLLLSALIAAASDAGTPVEKNIAGVLQAQSAAWSRGDLEAFVSHYAEDATFISPSGITRGRAEVLARYKRRYPDAAAMGRLELELVEARPLFSSDSGQAVSVVARWRLSFPNKPAVSGSTLLVLERRGAHWRIVQDASM